MISTLFARRLLLARQGLADAPRGARDRMAVQRMIERIGFVQVDSINTVARAHDMILRTRLDGYRPDDLARLLERDRTLFETWTHDAAILPSALFPYWRRVFEREADALRARWRKWRRDGFEALFDAVLERVARDGPIRSRDLADMDAAAEGGDGWWDWRPSKTALEFLWRTGDLAVCRRDGFQKVYDLTERVIPAAHRADAADDAALVDWACRAALTRLGIATSGELAAFWGVVTPEEAKVWAADAIARDAVATVSIAGRADAKPRRALMDPAAVDLHPDDLAPPTRLRALSPFDPVIRDRKRLERLFGFDYRIEVFTPAAKRAYGYYVFPLLEGDRFVGRIDMRRRGEPPVLEVDGLWWEPGARPSRGRMERLEAELARAARFAGCETVRFADGVAPSAT